MRQVIVTHTNNLRGLHVDRAIEPPQIRLLCSALLVFSCLFILRKSTVHQWTLQPFACLKTSCNREII